MLPVLPQSQLRDCGKFKMINEKNTLNVNVKAFTGLHVDIYVQ